RVPRVRLPAPGPLEHLAHVGQHAPADRVETGERGEQRERLHALRCEKRHMLRDRAPHRAADDVRALDAERVHQAERVSRELLRRDRLVVLRAPACTSVVERDRSVTLCQQGQLGQPGGVVAREAVDEDDREALTLLDVEELVVSDLEQRHRQAATSMPSRDAAVAPSSFGSIPTRLIRSSGTGSPMSNGRSVPSTILSVPTSDTRKSSDASECVIESNQNRSRYELGGRSIATRGSRRTSKAWSRRPSW